eukprot:4079102-Alexandrium_andersonii.AAC.1
MATPMSAVAAVAASFGETEPAVATNRCRPWPIAGKTRRARAQKPGQGPGGERLALLHCQPSGAQQDRGPQM